jgi:hypothetical protein
MAERFVVNTDGLNFRSAPEVDSSNVLATLPNGQVVMKLAVETDQDWWKVSTIISGQRTIGFVSQKFLAPATYKVIAGSLNLRSTPIKAPDNLITALPKDQIVEKLEAAIDQDWWKVITTVVTTTGSNEEIEGYVNSRYLAALNDPFEGKQVVGIDNTSQSFRDKVVQIADRLGTKPLYLMAVMSFETGGTFSPSIKSPVSGATGLIQFISSTARGLGTSQASLARMTALEQLDYVEKYLKPFRGRLLTLEDAYMAVLWPAAVGKGRNHVIFEDPTIEYKQNRGLDINNSGKITVAEAANKVTSRII